MYLFAFVQDNSPFRETKFESGKSLSWELLNFVVLGVFCGVGHLTSPPLPPHTSLFAQC